LNRIQIGKLKVQFPSGAEKIFSGSIDGPTALIQIHKLNLVRRLIISGDIGLAESFMAEEWDTPNLTALIRLGELNEKALGNAATPSKLMRLFNRLRHGRRANSRRGSKKNIAAHYDLGNHFYSNWLDKSMSYSSGLFPDLTIDHEAAQRNKYLRLAEQLDLKEGQTILEIGCGWGGFAEIAATEFKCKVVGLTLSKEQAIFAQDRMEKAQVSDLVDIRIQDYRDVQGDYDKIVSIEMFEAVGKEHWNNYFDVIKSRLKKGGKAAIQSITIADAFFDKYTKEPDFIQKYIFPGGVLPSPTAFNASLNDAELVVSDAYYFGKSYAETLRRWQQSFDSKWHNISPLGFDERFRRMWKYYLSYCEAGFESGHIDVGQFVINHK
jgi:cyclopropane-fatty-acyl-phospholipid synthase